MTDKEKLVSVFGKPDSVDQRSFSLCLIYEPNRIGYDTFVIYFDNNGKFQRLGAII